MHKYYVESFQGIYHGAQLLRGEHEANIAMKTETTSQSTGIAQVGPKTDGLTNHEKNFSWKFQTQWGWEWLGVAESTRHRLGIWSLTIAPVVIW